MSNLKGTVCPICGDKAEVCSEESFYDFVTCESCGRFEILSLRLSSNAPSKNELSSYLYYNGLISQPINNDDGAFFNFIGHKDKFNKDFERYPHCYFVTKETVDNWYPRTFSEKIDTILLGLAKLSKYEGDVVKL